MTHIVFFGTPDAAIPSLEALASRFDVGLVVTQPDRPKGRSGTPVAPPVKTAAVARGLRVAQPEESDAIAPTVAENGPFDVGVVVAYGKILKPEAFEIPRAGVLNVHFSLLPRWRGAAPVARAMMAGDTMTGVTIIRIDEGLDTGPVLTAQGVDVLPQENAGQLTERLALVGARLVTSVITPYVGGELLPVDQVEEGASYAYRLKPEDRVLDVTSSATGFVNRVRALAPAPAATLAIDGERHKVLAARLHDKAPGPGTWEAVDGAPVVAVGGQGVELVELQPPGRRAQSGTDWVRGRHRSSGEVS